MDVADGLVDCDWRVGISSCSTAHEKNVIRAVLIVCVCCYLLLAIVGYSILCARRRHNLTPPGPIIDFHHPDGGIRPKPIESFCVLSIAGLLVRSVSIFLVIIDAFPYSTIVQELFSELAVCCSFPCWACFVIGVWYATPKLSVPNDGVKIRVPPPSVINSVFIYLLFGPFLLDLPSVISSGTFLAQKKYTKANTAIAVHFLTLGGVLLIATIIYYFTLDQLTKAMAEYTVPSELTLVHVGVSPNVEFSGGQTFTLSPPTEREKEEDEIWDTSLAKARHRLISIRNAGTAMLSFYVIIYSIYGISRPLIHSHIVWNIVFCLLFNLDPGTPTIYAYFIFSILYHINARSSCLPQTDPLPRPPMVHIPASRPSRPRSDSYIFDLRRPSVAGVGPGIPRRSPSMRSIARSMDLHSLSRADTITDKNNHLDQGQASRNHTVVNMESTLPTQKSIATPS